jgi:hypothetical protein
MLFAGLVLIELIAIFFVSQLVVKNLFRFFLLVFRNHTVSMSLVTAILFPGTVIHELSHLFTAEVLGVRTGKLTLIPESLEGHIKAGSVEISQTDPFRRYIIGLAPTLIGVPTLAVISWWINTLIPFVWASVQSGTLFGDSNFYLLIFAAYLLFTISNTMFSSPQDLKDFLPFAITILLFGGALYVAGVRITLTGQALEFTSTIFSVMSKGLGTVLGVNIVILIVGFFIIRLIENMFHIRISEKK